MEYIILFVVIIVGYSIWNGIKNKIDVSVKPVEERLITDETILQTQREFEENMFEMAKIGVPNAMFGQEIYIYTDLMKPWFEKLSAKYRYDEQMIQKLRNDWLDYMFTLPQYRSSVYLSLDYSDEDDKENEEKKQKECEKDAYIEGNKITVIEDFFAHSIGDDAVKELDQIRKLSHSHFSHLGEMAPMGSHYNFDDEIVKNKR